MKKIRLLINGIDEKTNPSIIEKTLKKKNKIKKVSLDKKTETITIVGSEDLMIEELEDYVEEIGYSSSGVDLVSTSSKKELIPMVFLGIVLIIVFYLSLATSFQLPFSSLLNNKTRMICLGILSLIFLMYGMSIIIDGLKNVLQGRNNLNTLIMISMILIYSYSYISMYFSFSKKSFFDNYLFLEIAFFMIYFQKIGNWLEAKNKREIDSEIRQISKTNINKVNCKNQDTYKEIKIQEVKKGDRIICLPGDKILLDGILEEGNTHIDESSIFGYSLPTSKEKNSKITSGSINCENEFEYVVEKNIKNSYFNQIKKIVLEEKHLKRKGRKKIDKFCNYFVPILVVVSIIIFLLNYLLTFHLYTSLTKIMLLYVIGCPFGLSLVSALAFQKTMKFANKKGILIKHLSSLEQLREIDTIIFDKTGTLTNGYLSISKINNHSDMEDKEILELLGSIEKHSTHALARGITKYLRSEKIKAKYDFITEDLIGYGVKAKDEDTIYYACNSELLEKLDIINSYKEEERKLKVEGNDVIYLTKNSKVIATIGLRDNVKKESKKVIQFLKDKKIDIILLTGDKEEPSKKIAKELEIENIKYGLDAKEKNKIIKDLLKQGKKVMMIGDGINDAPSLASSTMGISFKSSLDPSISAADIILNNNNLLKIMELFTIRKIQRKIERQNIRLSFITSFLLLGFIVKFYSVLQCWMLVLGMFSSIILVIFNTIRIKNK